MADSRVEIRSMMRRTIRATRADRDSTRHRSRGGILPRRLVGVVISSREGIRHHPSTHRSTEGTRWKGKSGGDGERKVKDLTVDEVCYAMNWPRA